MIFEIINSTSSVLTALTAIVMAYLGWKEYIKSPTQEEDTNSFNENKSLVIFDTSKQETRLERTQIGLTCYLKNKSTNIEKIQWTISGDECSNIKNNKLISTGFKSYNTGLIHIGLNHKNWLYSKRLYPDSSFLEKCVYDML